jgi:hypothetical protein
VIYETYPQARLRQADKLVIDALDGYRRLLKNERSRLGWRILAAAFLIADANAAIVKAHTEYADLVDYLPRDFVDTHLDVVRARRAALTSAIGWWERSSPNPLLSGAGETMQGRAARPTSPPAVRRHRWGPWRDPTRRLQHAPP